MTGILFLIGDLILLAAAIGGTVFAVSYAAFFAWRKTQAGRAVLYFVSSLVAVFASNLVARLFGYDYTLREFFRIAVYGAVAITVWRLVYVLWTSWGRQKKPPKDQDAQRRTETKETS